MAGRLQPVRLPRLPGRGKFQISLLMKILDILITRVVLSIVTFAKRHPGVALVVILLLIVIPPISAALSLAAGFFAGKAWGKAITTAILKLSDYIANKPHVWWMLIWAIAIVAPLLGAL